MNRFRARMLGASACWLLAPHEGEGVGGGASGTSVGGAGAGDTVASAAGAETLRGATHRSSEPPAREPDFVEIDLAERVPTGSREPNEYEKRLRRDAQTERRRREKAETDLAEARRAIEDQRAETIRQVREAEDRIKTEQRARDDAARDARKADTVKKLLKEAGILDDDLISVVDTAEITVGEDGVVQVPDKWVEKVKAARPKLFGATGTSRGEPPPSSKGAKPANVLDLSPEEYERQKRAFVSGRGRTGGRAA